MALAVCLLFDARSDRLVRGLWSRLEEQGIRTLESHTHRRHHPHLSYAVLRSWDLDALAAAVDDVPDGGPVTLACQGTLAFPRGRAALAVATSADLARRQERIVSALDDTGAELHRSYRAGCWVPHVSVATRAQGGSLTTVVTTIADTLPITLHVDRAALIDSSTGRSWPLRHIP